jgi:hypothetical protein
LPAKEMESAVSEGLSDDVYPIEEPPTKNNEGEKLW